MSDGGSSGPRRPAKSTGKRSTGHKKAAQKAVQEQSITIDLPLGVKVSLPPPQHLAYYAGIGVLTALEMVDWPVALVLALGKALADNRSNATLRDFGEALDEAG